MSIVSSAPSPSSNNEFLIFVQMIQFKRQFSKKTKFVLCLASAFLLSLSWWGASCITLFIGFVPLLLLSAQYTPSWRDTLSMLGFATLTFVLWNIATIWWVWIASPAGPITATIVSTWWNLVAFMAYHIISKRAPKGLAYITFITLWIATEYIYNEAPAMSFPWLVLGNGFADDVWAVQWYEYTGVFGGTLWVLITNILAFDALLTMRKRVWTLATLALVVPMGISVVLYHFNDVNSERYTSLDECTVSVIQPNVNCYEKFNGDTRRQQENLMELLAEVPDSAEFALMPETALAEMMDARRPSSGNIVQRISRYLCDEKPNTMVVVGAETILPYGPLRGSATARRRGGQYVDIYNSVLGIDSSLQVQMRHKGKLVIGVETTPAWLREGGKFAIDLGGTLGQLGYGESTKPFVHNDKKVASAICYEGLYGNYMANFVREGAEALFVVSNDGWWGNTLGHRYLFAYCRLRAIELRRDVARSANTGVSGFITMRGEDMERMEWEERGVRSANIRLNDRVTFYAKYGDYIARLSLYIALLCLLYFVAYCVKKKYYLN